MLSPPPFSIQPPPPTPYVYTKFSSALEGDIIFSVPASVLMIAVSNNHIPTISAISEKYANGIRIRFENKRKRKERSKNTYLNISSLCVGNGKMVGTSGGSLSGLPSLAANTIVAPTSDSTKNECQWVCVTGKRNEKESESAHTHNRLTVKCII